MDSWTIRPKPISTIWTARTIRPKPTISAIRPKSGQGNGPMAMEAPIPHANPEYGSPL